MRNILGSWAMKATTMGPCLNLGLILYLILSKSNVIVSLPHDMEKESINIKVWMKEAGSQ